MDSYKEMVLNEWKYYGKEVMRCFKRFKESKDRMDGFSFCLAYEYYIDMYLIIKDHKKRSNICLQKV